MTDADLAKLDPDILRRKCHFLVDEVAKHPYGRKLMIGVYRSLKLFLAYKGDRGRKRFEREQRMASRYS